MILFHAGQKVVCVDDKRRVAVRSSFFGIPLGRWIKLDHNLNRGDIYRIVCVTTVRSAEGYIVQTLHVDAACHFEHPEIGFPSFQFRPLIEKKTNTDISVFTKLLNPTPAFDKFVERV